MIGQNLNVRRQVTSDIQRRDSLLCKKKPLVSKERNFHFFDKITRGKQDKSYSMGS